MAKTKKEIEEEIRKWEKENILEGINSGTTFVLDSWESELKLMAECIKLLGIKKDELHFRQFNAYVLYGEDILLVKEELLKDNVESDRVTLRDPVELDKYLRT